MRGTITNIILCCVFVLALVFMQTCNSSRISKKDSEIALLSDSINRIINSPPDTISRHDTVYKRVTKTVYAEIKVPVPYTFVVRDTVYREYKDTISSDTIDIFYNVVTSGFLHDIDLGYRLTIPEKVTTITIQKPPILETKYLYKGEWILGISIDERGNKVPSLEYLSNKGIGVFGEYHSKEKYYGIGMKISINRIFKR